MALNASRFALAEYERNIWVVTPEAETPFEALQEPAYWAHVAAKLKPWDVIEVRAEDGSYWAQLLVQDASRLWAKVALLKHVQLHAVEPKSSEIDGHLVKFGGPVKKWTVIRQSDKAVLRDGLSKAEAEKWLADHLRAVA